jgi:hypothetical protein
MLGGLHHLTAQFNKDMQDYTPSTVENATANLAEAYTRNKQYLHMWLSHCTTTSRFAH